MASIARKHAYRFGYLKSEHWSNLRLEKLAEQDACCQICKHRDLGNDVHHVIYRQPLFTCTVDDLVVLCRECHDKVHKVLDRFESIKKLDTASERWKVTLKKLQKLARLERIEPQRIAYIGWVTSTMPELGHCPRSKKQKNAWYASARKSNASREKQRHITRLQQSLSMIDAASLVAFLDDMLTLHEHEPISTAPIKFYQAHL